MRFFNQKLLRKFFRKFYLCIYWLYVLIKKSLLIYLNINKYTLFCSVIRYKTYVKKLVGVTVQKVRVRFPKRHKYY